ncbi:hypothetical protein ABH976_004229 [Bradyrhizobium ottawaense]
MAGGSWWLSNQHPGNARSGGGCSLDSNQANRGQPEHNIAHAHLIGRDALSDQLHPMAPHHLPFYLAPGSGTDTLMVVMGLFLIGTVLWVGTLYWKLHSLPERMAHKSQKLQFEFVAVLGLISLFTHMHIFWIAGLLLALIDLPDFGTPLRSIAGSVEKIAEAAPAAGGEEIRTEAATPPEQKPEAAKKEHSHV